MTVAFKKDSRRAQIFLFFSCCFFGGGGGLLTEFQFIKYLRNAFIYTATYGFLPGNARHMSMLRAMSFYICQRGG